MQNDVYRGARPCCLSLVAFITLAAMLAGCNSRPYDVVPVSGRFTINGQPIPNASITTQPIAAQGSIHPGPGSFGKTDADGRFELELVDPAEAGAVVGQHRVTITTAGHSADPESDMIQDVPRDMLPPACRDGSLVYEVPAGGTDAFNIELQF